MNLKQIKLPLFALGAGALGFCLRLFLYRTGFDERNILSSSHPLHLACLALTVIVAFSLLAALWKLGRDCDPEETFPRTPLGSLCILAAACLTAHHGLVLCRNPGDLVDTLRTVLAFACAVSMALCALPGANRGLRIGALEIITAFFTLDMLARYQSWSGNPQLPDYILQVFACMVLSLCSYHRLAFCTGLGKRRPLLFCSLMGLYLCLVCAAGPETAAFYLGGACWAGGCMCAPVISEPKEQEENP